MSFVPYPITTVCIFLAVIAGAALDLYRKMLRKPVEAKNRVSR